MTDRYINIFTDFGFKKIFGEEVNKDLLIISGDDDQKIAQVTGLPIDEIVKLRKKSA